MPDSGWKERGRINSSELMRFPLASLQKRGPARETREGGERGEIG